MLKKIFKALAYVFVLTSIMMLLGFAVDSNNKKACNAFNIRIQYSGDNYFVEEKDIRNEVYSVFDTIEGKPLEDVNIEAIKGIVDGMEFIESVYVYRTVTGEINLVAQPRKPIIRVINKDNKSFYIDSRGKLMPFSNKYTSRVPVVFGNINAPYSPVINLNNPETHDLSKNYQRLIEIYQLAKYIDNDTFWRAFIDQIYITDKGEAEIIPKGNIHRIIFGNITDIDKKFNKLRMFYKNGLTRVGWQQYHTVNLKFNNQIVCSK